MTIRAFLVRRTQFKELLTASTQISVDRYWRLMALATVDIVCTVPFATWILITNIEAGLDPYKGLADSHKQISAVIQVPRIFWSSDPIVEASVEASRWSCVACALIFFAFFGFAEEAKKHYKLALCSVAKKMGVSTSFIGSSGFVSSSGYDFTPLLVYRDG
jgi:pheromone a factor receptor